MQWLFDIVVAMVMPQFKGMIVMWSGTEADIPDGWTLCDGTLGTPDLRAKFAMGSWGPATSHLNGGSMIHAHDFTGDGHSHTLLAGAGVGIGTTRQPISDSQSAVGTTDNNDDVPPYYVLAFIMKL